MSKLEDLKNTLKDLFDNSTDKKDIDNYSKLSTLVDDVDKEIKKQTEDHQALLKDYKEAIKYTSFKPANNENMSVVQGKPNFESMLSDFSKNLKK